MVDLNGVDEHTVQELQIGTFGAVTESQCGPIIAMLPQMAYMPDGKAITSCPQVEHYKNIVNEKSLHITGKAPCIVTLEGHGIPITIRNGLPHIHMRPYTDKEWVCYPEYNLGARRTGIPLYLMPWYRRDGVTNNQRN